MKKCPVCSEEIRTDAIKCSYCGERFDTKPTPSKAASFPHKPSPWQIYEKLKSTWSLTIIGFLVCIIVPVVIMAGQKDNTETDNRLVSTASAPAPTKKYEFQADPKAEARREAQRPLHKMDGTLRELLHAMSPSQFKSYVDEHPGIPGLSYIEHKDGKIEKVIPPEPVSSGSGADVDAAQAQRENDSGSQQLESDTQRQQLESDLRRQKLESDRQRRQLEDDIRRQKLENRQLESDMRRQKLESDRQRRQLDSDLRRQQTESDMLRQQLESEMQRQQLESDMHQRRRW